MKSRWQRIRNLQKSAEILTFLTTHNIKSVEDFADTVERMHNNLKDTTDELHKTDRRLNTLANHMAHNESIKAHKAVYQKYKALAPKTDPAALNSINPFTKNKAVKEHEAATKKQDAFYQKHAAAIEAYQAAQDYFAAVMNGRTKLPIADWQKEQKALSAKRYGLCEKYYSLKDELPSIEAIRRSVENLMQGAVQREQPKRARDTAL